MNTRFLRNLPIFVIVWLALIGCASQTGPHTWSAGPVVASLYYSPGYTADTYAWSAMPPLVVYADGRVIVVDYDLSGEDDIRSVKLARVEPAEVCALLNRIDGYGFFDYDAAKYPRPDITDNSTTVIKVDAWRSMEARAYALGHALDTSIPRMGLPPLTVPSALSETYRLLADYRPANLAPYQPERIALRIKRGGDPSEAPAWPLAAPSLGELAAQASDDEVVLSGQQAAEVYALFGASITRFYADGADSYQITMRPLLPLETWQTQQGWGHEATFEAEPKTELTCAP